VPVIEAAMEAIKRGVEVTLYLDIGFNDAVRAPPYCLIAGRILLIISVIMIVICLQGEMLPLQGQISLYT
jgi:hypothetical protein